MYSIKEEAGEKRGEVLQREISFFDFIFNLKEKENMDQTKCGVNVGYPASQYNTDWLPMISVVCEALD